MTIEVPPGQLYALADALRAQADEGDEITTRLAGAPALSGLLRGPAEAFLEAHRAAGTAAAGAPGLPRRSWRRTARRAPPWPASCAGWAGRSPPSPTRGSGWTVRCLPR